MIHYTCDRCKKIIDENIDLRYEVSIVTQVALDVPDSNGQEDRDHLHDVDDLLQRVDDEECEQLCQELYQSRRFDLCANCFQQFSRNPLAADAQPQVEFSEN